MASAKDKLFFRPDADRNEIVALMQRLIAGETAEQIRASERAKGGKSPLVLTGYVVEKAQ